MKIIKDCVVCTKDYMYDPNQQPQYKHICQYCVQKGFRAKQATKREVLREIDFEDKCGVNTLLQQLISDSDTPAQEKKVFLIFNKNSKITGYFIEETGEQK